MSPDVGKLRELAEEVLERSGSATWLDADHLARGLLSALDALEAANRRAELVEARRLEQERNTVRMKERAEAAEASRDQAIKERDEARKALVTAALPLEVLAGQISVRSYRELSDELQAEIERAVLTIRAALAGVPGGSPEEEHNPGGTAVAVPGESEEA